jgi:hypothetical protein
MGTTHWPKDPLDGADINLLAGVLRRWCARQGVEFSGDTSQSKARELVQWFEFGVKDPTELEDLLDGTHWQVSVI